MPAIFNVETADNPVTFENKPSATVYGEKNG